MPIRVQRFLFSVFNFSHISPKKEATKGTNIKSHNVPFNFIITAMDSIATLWFLWCVPFSENMWNIFLMVLWGQKDVLELKCFHGIASRQLQADCWRKCQDLSYCSCLNFSWEKLTETITNAGRKMELIIL